jgi:hypothetical protein
MCVGLEEMVGSVKDLNGVMVKVVPGYSGTECSSPYIWWDLQEFMACFDRDRDRIWRADPGLVPRFCKNSKSSCDYRQISCV